MCVHHSARGRAPGAVSKAPNTVPNDVYEETWDEDDLSDAIPGAANADLRTMVLAEHSRWCTWGAGMAATCKSWPPGRCSQTLSSVGCAYSRGSGSLEAGTQELFAESLAKGRLNMPLANAVRVAAGACMRRVPRLRTRSAALRYRRSSLWKLTAPAC